MSNSAEAFDWVKARAPCNSEELFGDLFKVVRGDVESACKHVEGAASSITLRAGPSCNSFTVLRHEPGQETIVTEAVRFNLEGSDIVVTDKASRPVTRARPALDGGNCKLEVDNCAQPMRLWQFSRSLLENLIFRGQ